MPVVSVDMRNLHVDLFSYLLYLILRLCPCNLALPLFENAVNLPCHFLGELWTHRNADSRNGLPA